MPVAQMHWVGQGLDHELNWAGLNWRLRLDGPSPGLELAGTSRANVLTLDGLAVRGHSYPWPLERPTLTKAERLFDRVEATYQFADRGGLSVRASWSLVPERDGVDLEVQVLASSVDSLKAVEILVGTRFDRPTEASIATTPALDELWVEPRDGESAALSYDGRDSLDILQKLWTLPIPGGVGAGFAPRVLETPWLGKDLFYIEFVHPDDVSRRLERRPSSGSPSSASESGHWTRYSIFGHDLEKGVLLRSRMRGVWCRGEITADALATMYRSFRNEPLPLGP